MSSYVVIMFIKYEDGDSSYIVNNHNDSEVMMMMIPIDLTLLGIVTFVSLLHPQKALKAY